MKYRLFQYYNDELSGWNKDIEFYKEHSGMFVRQITVGLDQEHIGLSLEKRKKSSNFIDQFVEQERNLNLLASQINSQLQRLERSSISPDMPLEDDICTQQDSLRAMIDKITKKFNRTRHACSMFLSSLFTEQLLPQQEVENRDGVAQFKRVTRSNQNVAQRSFQ